jgi:hypothetical protein
LLSGLREEDEVELKDGSGLSMTMTEEVVGGREREELSRVRGGILGGEREEETGWIGEQRGLLFLGKPTEPEEGQLTTLGLLPTGGASVQPPRAVEVEAEAERMRGVWNGMRFPKVSSTSLFFLHQDLHGFFLHQDSHGLS